MKRVWQGKRFSVLVEGHYEIADTPTRSRSWPWTREERVVFVRQRRVATGGELVELPAGLIDARRDAAGRGESASFARKQACTAGAGAS